MRKLFLLFFFQFFLLQTSKLIAQDYKSAIGIQLGSPSKISYKHFISKRGALEGLFSHNWNSNFSQTNIGIRYLHHIPIKPIQGLSFYFGGGLDFNRLRINNSILLNYEYPGFSIIPKGVVGLDYAFAKIPLNVSLEWTPQIGFPNPYSNRIGINSISFRYMFKSKK